MVGGDSRGLGDAVSVWGTGTRPALLCEQTELLCPGGRAEEEVSTTGKRREQDRQGGYAPPLWYCWRFNRPVRPAELLLRRPSKTAAGRTAVRASGHVQAPDDDDDDDPTTSVWQLDSSTWPLVPDHSQVRPTGLGLKLSRQERLELTSCPRPPPSHLSAQPTPLRQLRLEPHAMLDHVSISHESTSSPALAKLRRMQV
jgi:hypothetical protein